MILHNRSGIIRAEFYFDEEPFKVEADTVHCFQSPVPRPGFRSISFHTRVIDLRHSRSDLEHEIDRDTRREIRKAELRDELLYSCCTAPDAESIDEVVGLQDQFAAQKCLPRTDRRYLVELAKAGVLDICYVRDPAGNPLVWRTYYRGSRRMRALQGGSLFRGIGDSRVRQLYGRANRLLWYKDLFRAQELGLCEFDLGGWYVGNEDQEKLFINRLKGEFGGTVLEEFHCSNGLTLKGKLALAAGRARGCWLAWQRCRTILKRDAMRQACRVESAKI